MVNSFSHFCSCVLAFLKTHLIKKKQVTSLTKTKTKMQCSCEAVRHITQHFVWWLDLITLVALELWKNAVKNKLCFLSRSKSWILKCGSRQSNKICDGKLMGGSVREWWRWVMGWGMDFFCITGCWVTLFWVKQLDKKKDVPCVLSRWLFCTCAHCDAAHWHKEEKSHLISCFFSQANRHTAVLWHLRRRSRQAECSDSHDGSLFACRNFIVVIWLSLKSPSS